MPNGAIGIVVDGSTPNTELTINPLPKAIRKGYAHSYAYGLGGETHLINIGQITINSGTIGSIEGFHTADLSGPINIPSTATVDRIAFNAILPGASITTGGTVNTLDVYQGITLNTGTSIQIGNPSVNIDNSIVPVGDLNLLNVGGNIVLENGSQIIVGRDIGQHPSTAQGNRQRKQCPVAQPAFDHHAGGSSPGTRGFRLHPGQYRHPAGKAPSSSAAALTRRSSSSAISPAATGS